VKPRRILCKDEQSMIIWKMNLTWILGSFPYSPFGCTHALLDGNLPHSNIKIGKLNTPTIFKILLECSSFYEILA